MKVKLTESSLNGLIVNSIKKILRESYGLDDPNNYDDEGEYWGPERIGNYDEPYEGNDLDYDSIKMEAEDIIQRLQDEGTPVSWKTVAHEMGFRMDTLNGDDMELLKDAIEDAMMEDEQYSENRIDAIINESIRKIIKEYGNTSDGQKRLGALQARKVINATGRTDDELFKNQSSDGGNIYNYAKKQRSKLGKDSDEFGNTINPLYKDYAKGYTEYLNSHPQEMADRKERLRNLGYYN